MVFTCLIDNAPTFLSLRLLLWESNDDDMLHWCFELIVEDKMLIFYESFTWSSHLSSDCVPFLGMPVHCVSSSKSFGFTNYFQGAPYLINPFEDPSTFWRMDSFEWFDVIILLGNGFYIDYITIIHSPIKFQDNTLSFVWVSEVVIVGLFPIFQPGFPFL